MKDIHRDETNISPAVYRAVRIVAGLLALLLIFFTGKAAITFCLGLFADGNHVVQLPGQDSPIVSLNEISKPRSLCTLIPVRLWKSPGQTLLWPAM